MIHTKCNPPAPAAPRRQRAGAPAGARGARGAGAGAPPPRPSRCSSRVEKSCPANKTGFSMSTSL